ncbi:hypothetical protein pb186bvf_021051 [Paramecium bursaria]
MESNLEIVGDGHDDDDIYIADSNLQIGIHINCFDSSKGMIELNKHLFPEHQSRFDNQNDYQYNSDRKSVSQNFVSLQMSESGLQNCADNQSNDSPLKGILKICPNSTRSIYEVPRKVEFHEQETKIITKKSKQKSKKNKITISMLDEIF